MDNIKTTDHEEIKKWVEERGGVPAVVKNGGEEQTGILRVIFKEFGTNQRLEEITWERFFEIFDARGLVFLYQEKTKGGDQSRFFKFVRE